MRSLLLWLGVSMASMVVAGVGFAAYLEYVVPGRHLSRSLEHPAWYNPIPGAANSLPELLIIMKGPWPLPPGQNAGAAIRVRIPVDVPVIVRGRPNDCRYWSFTFYEQGSHSAATPSIGSPEIELEEDGSYEVVFSSRPAGTNWVSTGSATAGAIAMRNYLPRLGTPVRLPAVYAGDRLVVASEELSDVQ